MGRVRKLGLTSSLILNTLADGVYIEEELCNTDQANQDEKILSFFSE